MVDAWHKKKIKVKAKKESEMSMLADKVDRNNINLPLIVEEKRSMVMSDPEVPGQAPAKGPSSPCSLTLKEETVLTMKKVSSLALV